MILDTQGARNVSDSRRDAQKYYSLLFALERVTGVIRDIEEQRHPDIGQVLDKLLPGLAAALNGEQGFVAVLRKDGDSDRNWLELTAVYPREELRGCRLGWSDLLQKLVEDGRPQVIDPLGEQLRDPIPGLEVLGATSAVLTRIQTTDHVHVVGICNKANPDLGPYLAVDKRALDSILGLVAIGIRIGERRRRELEGIQKTSAAISAELDLTELLPMIVKRAAEVFGAPAASLMLLDEAKENLVIQANEGLSDEYIQRQRIPVERIRAALADMGGFRPAVTLNLQLGSFGRADIDANEQLYSALSAGLVVSGEWIGLLNIYSKDEARKFSSEEIELAGILANQAAIAIQNAYLRRREISSLLATSSAIKAALDLDVLLSLITDRANAAFDAPATGLSLWDEPGENLVVQGSWGLSEVYTRQQRISREKIQAAFASGAESRPLFIADVRVAPLGEPSLYQQENLCSALIAPLLASNRLIGTLEVYSQHEPRRFTPAETELATILANQAASAIEAAQLHQQARQRGEQLAALDQIALVIAQRLETRELLRAIVERATELVRGAGGGVYLWNEIDQTFRVEAVRGLAAELEGQCLEKGRGIIGLIKQTKWPMAVTDYQHWPNRLEMLDEYQITAVVGAPIMSGERFLGVIAVHDTREGRVFGEAEKELLHRLGNHAAVALENAGAYMAEQEAKTYLDRLISSSLDGIIAVDDDGWVKVFNEGAERILGYSRDEVLDRRMRVDKLYSSYETARQVKRHVIQQGRLPNYETTIRAKDGQIIPVLLSGTALSDGAGKIIGSVGFFKDLRPLRKAEANLRLVLDTINTVNSARSLGEGLSALAEKMVNGLNVSFCHILLLDKASQTLKVEAAYPIPNGDGTPRRWEPTLGRTIWLEDMPGMRYLTEMLRPGVFRSGETVEGQEVIRHIQKATGLKEALESALIIPLKAGEGTFGVCTLGEVRTWEQSPFSEERMDLANSMASQAAVLIDRMRAHEITEHKLDEVRRLRAIGQDLVRAVTDRPKEILDKVAQAACEVIRADSAVIYPWDKEKQSYEISGIAHYGLRREKSFSSKARNEEGSMTAVVLKKGTVIVDDVNRKRDRTGQVQIWTTPGGFMADEKVEAFAGIALRIGDEPLGALFVSLRKPHHFTDDELETITLFANQAAVAIQQSRLFHQVSEEGTRLRSSLLKVGSSISELRSLQDILHSTAYGIQHVLDCDVVTVYSYDEKNDYLPHPAVVAGELFVPGKMKGYGTLLKNQIFQLLIDRDKPYFADNAPQDEIMSAGGFVKREKIQSSAGVPLSVGSSQVGLLFVNFRDKHQFSANEKEAVRIFANQAAVAIHNARLYEAAKRESQHREAVVQAGKAIIAGFTGERRQVLNSIVQQAVELITGVEGNKATWGAILMYDEAAAELGFESVYLSTALVDVEAKVGDRITLDRNKAPDGKIGITGRAVLEGKSQRVADVRVVTDYLEYDIHTRSELVVPLFDRNKVLGVLSVESDQLDAFDENDEQALKDLAEMAVIAIKNAEQAERLGRTSAVAFMGAWGADIAHDINREVGAIRRAIFLLQQRADLSPQVQDGLRKIDDHAGRVELPEVPPQQLRRGGTLEQRGTSLLDQVVQTEVANRQLVHPSVSLQVDLNAPGVRVAMHEQWLRRLLRHLINNAVTAIPPDKERRVVIVRTSIQESTAEVQVEDTGKGVRPSIRPLLFEEPIPHKDGRLGRGLLLVRFLAEQHGGGARLVRSRPGKGACFAFKVLRVPSAASVDNQPPA